MIVLGLDTSTTASAVALGLGDGSLREARDDPPAGAHPGHATRLLELARGLLEEAGLRWGEIDRVAAGVGPGTFTGLRVGLATARGLAQSLGAELVGVSSLQALAAELLAVIDARRGEVFAAAFQARSGAAPAQLSEPGAFAPEALGGVIAGAAQAGADPARWLAIGDGAVRYRAALERESVRVPGEDSPLHRVSAATICSLALDSEPAGGPLGLLPDYRRRPDAELALAPSGSVA